MKLKPWTMCHANEREEAASSLLSAYISKAYFSDGMGFTIVWHWQLPHLERLHQYPIQNVRQCQITYTENIPLPKLQQLLSLLLKHLQAGVKKADATQR